MNNQPLRPQVVLGIAAHPDDLDFGAAGAIATFARQGADVYYLILTDGCNGTTDRRVAAEELAHTRQGEQCAAGKVLGVKDVYFCKNPDGCLENTKDVRRDIVKTIRQVKPDVVITWDPSMLYCVKYGIINHGDHRASGQAALDAVYPLARDHLAYPELLDKGYEPHKTKTVLLMNFNESNYGVDITDVFALKMQAIAAHASQIHDPSMAQALVTRFAEDAGTLYGAQYAESFMRIDLAA
jgi:LmbE family N-acetylglucosaminyl deacetylase